MINFTIFYILTVVINLITGYFILREKLLEGKHINSELVLSYLILTSFPFFNSIIWILNFCFYIEKYINYSNKKLLDRKNPITQKVFLLPKTPEQEKYEGQVSLFPDEIGRVSLYE